MKLEIVNNPATQLVETIHYGQHRHIHYRDFERQQLPLGSGMVESACKWSIQQRFKGVGMGWSESSFNHLPILRVAWVNQRFDSLFPHLTLSRTTALPHPLTTPGEGIIELNTLYLIGRLIIFWGRMNNLSLYL
jgi:hypothetical protein